MKYIPYLSKKVTSSLSVIFRFLKKEYILYILELTYDLPLNEFCFVKNVFEIL